ncbi:lysozyme inhibitor LprI family protein [Roseiterribacter gracilis]|uniref:Lysozyme inhibitor LprI-like N-terminal domain-containing protein n=1 Tax=Roseiterribacter gracilis TaxID=2812848 RepID=A0A8S8X716_9PROT|nr:hypothetical protein TMPK1_14650 [Rhodospirillales bacterium TMPK1]
MRRALLASLLLFAPTAFAAPAPADVKTVEACIASHPTAPRQCIGVIADKCLEKAISTSDQTGCVEREHAVWDAWLNRDYGAAMRSLDDKMKAKLRDIQRQWITLRDARCAFPGEAAGGGTMWIPVAAYCAMEMTADQATWLKGQVEETKAK